MFSILFSHRRQFSLYPFHSVDSTHVLFLLHHPLQNVLHIVCIDHGTPGMLHNGLDQQLLLPGWLSNFTPAASAAHVSASGLMCPCPPSLLKALSPTFQDRLIWHESYMEEYNGLLKLDTFEEISVERYERLREKGANKAIPTM